MGLSGLSGLERVRKSNGLDGPPSLSFFSPFLFSSLGLYLVLPSFFWGGDETGSINGANIKQKTKQKEKSRLIEKSIKKQQQQQQQQQQKATTTEIQSLKGEHNPR